MNSAAVLIFAIGGGAIGQDTAWEFRVCADPNAYPASSQDRPGYANRIAEILADELGAELSYEWTRLDDRGLTSSLHAGKCDAVIGIGESVGGVVGTVPFLRAPYTFVSRSDRHLAIESLDDPRLSSWTIGTYPSGLPSLALMNRGLGENLREYPPIPSLAGPDRDSAILDAVVDGEVDVAVVYGPAAAARAEEEPGVLTVTPVSPETDVGATLIQLFRIRTIGVRPHDIVFRDRLNVAMAERWDEIQGAIEAYGVQGLEIGRPARSEPADEAGVRVGVVLPLPTGDHHPFEDVGDAAWRGVALAENSLARHPESRDVDFDILVASAPTTDAAVRAAERLAAVEDVHVLIGGYTPNQVRRLSEIAAKHQIAFFNIGSSDDRLRAPACTPTTLHVEASASMYLDAAIEWHAAAGPRSWYLIADAAQYGAEIFERFEESVARFDPNGVVAGTADAETGQMIFSDEIADIVAESPDVVVTALVPTDEDQFLAQFDRRSQATIVSAVPDLRTQTREFLYRFRQSGPSTALFARPVLWDAGLEAHGAAELNDTYAGRNAGPMEAASWGAYAAIRIAFDAAVAGVASDAATLAGWLTTSGRTFDVGKGPGVSFRPWDHQLRQPLALIRIDPDASWSRLASERRAFAEVVGISPRNDDGSQGAIERLDAIGRSHPMSTCDD